MGGVLYSVSSVLGLDDRRLSGLILASRSRRSALRNLPLLQSLLVDLKTLKLLDGGVRGHLGVRYVYIVDCSCSL
jgi:hypothetical protein